MSIPAASLPCSIYPSALEVGALHLSFVRRSSAAFRQSCPWEGDAGPVVSGP